MKEYPTIARDVVKQPIYAFDKLDGSNIRAEWSRKKGFYKFGKRHGLVGQDDPLLGEAQGLVESAWADDLDTVFRKQRWTQAIAFFEFWGDNSFAGLHEDEEHRVTLIDIGYEKKGIMPPKEYLKLFGGLAIAQMLYHGNPNADFTDAVRGGSLPGMTFEGVVCKGKPVSPGRPLMFKVKNVQWIDKLKGRCGDDTKLFERLL